MVNEAYFLYEDHHTSMSHEQEEYILVSAIISLSGDLYRTGRIAANSLNNELFVRSALAYR